MTNAKRLSTRERQQIYVGWVLDLLIYTVILNLFVQYVDDFYIETFALSLLVALALKVMLVIVGKFEHVVKRWFEKQNGDVFDYLQQITLVTILFLSKFLILEVIDLLFGHKVDLHNIPALILMIIAMIATRKILEKIYRNL